MLLERSELLFRTDTADLRFEPSAVARIGLDALRRSPEQLTVLNETREIAWDGVPEIVRTAQAIPVVRPVLGGLDQLPPGLAAFAALVALLGAAAAGATALHRTIAVLGYNQALERAKLGFEVLASYDERVSTPPQSVDPLEWRARWWPFAEPEESFRIRVPREPVPLIRATSRIFFPMAEPGAGLAIREQVRDRILAHPAGEWGAHARSVRNDERGDQAIGSIFALCGAGLFVAALASMNQAFVATTLSWFIVLALGFTMLLLGIGQFWRAHWSARGRAVAQERQEAGSTELASMAVGSRAPAALGGRARAGASFLALAAFATSATFELGSSATLSSPTAIGLGLTLVYISASVVIRWARSIRGERKH